MHHESAKVWFVLAVQFLLHHFDQLCQVVNAHVLSIIGINGPGLSKADIAIQLEDIDIKDVNQ